MILNLDITTMWSHFAVSMRLFWGVHVHYVFQYYESHLTKKRIRMINFKQYPLFPIVSCNKRFPSFAKLRNMYTLKLIILTNRT